MSDPTAISSIGWIILALAGVCMALNQMDDFMKRRQGKDGERLISPQPLEIKHADEFVHKVAFDSHVSENSRQHENIFSKLGGVERGGAEKLSAEIQTLRKERHDDSVETHKRINGLEKSVGGLEAATTLQNQSLAQIQSSLMRLNQKS